VKPNMKGISLIVCCALLACSSPHKKKANLLEEKNEKFIQCYRESDAYTFQKSQGSLKLSYIIETSGKVNEVKILEDDFKDPNLKTCMIEQMRKIKYSPRTQAKTETFLFNFQP
jgi:hypothetical protein